MIVRRRRTNWAIDIVVLLVMVVLLFAAAGCSSLMEPDEERHNLLEAIWADDLARIHSIVEANPGLKKGYDAQMTLIAAACKPGIADLLVNGLGFDVRFSDGLGGVVFQTVGVGRGPREKCPDEAVRESLEMMIRAGADPCATADRRTTAPFEDAEAEGWPQETVAMLRSYSGGCR